MLVPHPISLLLTGVISVSQTASSIASFAGQTLTGSSTDRAAAAFDYRVPAAPPPLDFDDAEAVRALERERIRLAVQLLTPFRGVFHCSLGQLVDLLGLTSLTRVPPFLIFPAVPLVLRTEPTSIFYDILLARHSAPLPTSPRLNIPKSALENWQRRSMQLRHAESSTDIRQCS